jgi:hypothetical protein
MSKIKTLLNKKYAHAVMVIYFLIYMPWFSWLNVFTPQRANVTDMYTKLDDMIPFCELFVIPYFVWFAYIAVGYVFLFFNNKFDFLRMCAFLYTGMTVCLIIYTLFPNGQSLRVDYDTLGRSNFMIDAIKSLQMGDTPYNVFPSIHCLNSIGMNIALVKNEWCKKHPSVAVCATILTTLICLSTVFVKQHSIIDLFGALALSVPLYIISYRVPWKKVLKIK